jgi:hypothetical protein
VDTVGNAIAVWSIVTDATAERPLMSQAVANRFSVTDGWSEPTLLGVQSNGHEVRTAVDVDTFGQGMVLWSGQEPGRNEVAIQAMAFR